MLKFNGENFFESHVFFSIKIYKKVFFASVIFWIFFIQMSHNLFKKITLALAKSVNIEV
jgi:hypothetical protein